MGILAQLEKPEFQPSKSDWILLQYMKENIQQVSRKTIAHLALEAGVGESTITRFVKKMGYKSLQTFKLALAEELTGSRYIINSSIKNNESARTTAQKLLDADIRALERTLAALPEGLVERGAEVMQEARHLWFIGLGNSGFMALDSAYKFYRIGIESQGIDNSHHMLMMAALASTGDVFVVVSHSGKTVEVLRTAELAKRNGATILAVSSKRHSPLCQLADIPLVYEAQESLLETGSIPVKMTQFFIMDLLYTQIVKGMAGRAALNKQKTTEAIDLLREN